MKTIRELSDAWGIDRSTLLKAAREGRVQAHQSGATWLINSHADLTQQWLRQGVARGRPRASMQEMIALRVRILGYARAIMGYQVEAASYPGQFLVNGLLPLKDISWQGKRYPGRLSKLADEQKEMRKKLPAYLANPSMGTKVPLLHEIADVVYNHVQAEFLVDAKEVTDLLNDWRIYGIERREIIAALDAKFLFRSSGPGKKDLEHEYSLIGAALALPSSPRSAVPDGF